MGNLLGKLGELVGKNKWAVVAAGAGATLTVALDVVPWDSAQGQAFGAGAAAVAAAGLAALGAWASRRFLGKGQDGASS